MKRKKRNPHASDDDSAFEAESRARLRHLRELVERGWAEIPEDQRRVPAHVPTDEKLRVLLDRGWAEHRARHG